MIRHGKKEFALTVVVMAGFEIIMATHPIALVNYATVWANYPLFRERARSV